MIKKGRKAGGKRVSQLDILKKDLDQLTKRIVFMAILTTELEKEGFSPVAGGNYAVELYTEGAFKSDAVEIFAPVDVLNKVLLPWGFDKVDGFLRHDEIGVTVRILGEGLNQNELDRVNQVDVNGFPVYLMGVEDTVTAKLKEFVHLHESDAIIWAQELIEIHVNEVDLDYLKERATQEGAIDPLRKLLLELRLEDEDEYGYGYYE